MKTSKIVLSVLLSIICVSTIKPINTPIVLGAIGGGIFGAYAYWHTVKRTEQSEKLAQELQQLSDSEIEVNNLYQEIYGRNKRKFNSIDFLVSTCGGALTGAALSYVIFTKPNRPNRSHSTYQRYRNHSTYQRYRNNVDEINDIRHNLQNLRCNSQPERPYRRHEMPSISPRVRAELDKIEPHPKTSDRFGEPCSICLGERINDTGLPCAHFFCSTCINGIINATPRYTTFYRCPTCRTEVPKD